MNAPSEGVHSGRLGRSSRLTAGDRARFLADGFYPS